MKRTALIFSGPEKVEVVCEEFSGPGPGQVLVQTLASGVSPGTEMLFYRGLVPEAMELDTSIPDLPGKAGYPFKYGYCNVGRVVELGGGVDADWLGKQVFSFHPHESHFCAATSQLNILEEGICPEAAVFLPNMETAVNLVLDGQPRLGETAAVFGLGVVGLLTCALLAQFPLGSLVTFDRYPRRRAEALKLGASASLDPDLAGAVQQAADGLAGGQDGVDLAFELSGSPAALNQAIELTGFAGRILIGSWYGKRRAEIDLGGKFHRSRIRLISSQVSSLAPELGGRWSKTRRLAAAFAQLQRIQPQAWITQRIPFGCAQQAYRLLAEQPEETIQIVFDYNTAG